jgi:hypothetical protein
LFKNCSFEILLYLVLVPSMNWKYPEAVEDLLLAPELKLDSRFA